MAGGKGKSSSGGKGGAGKSGVPDSKSQISSSSRAGLQVSHPRDHAARAEEIR